MNPTRSSRLIGFILAAFSVVFTLACFEVFLTWENYYQLPKIYEMEVDGDKYQFIYPVERLLEEAEQSRQHKRIFLFDASFVVGIQCAKKGINLSGHLQKLVGDQAEVINLAVTGGDPSSYIDFIDRFPLGKNDIAVVVLNENGIHQSFDTCARTTRQARNLPLFVPAICKGILEKSIEPKDEQGILRNINRLLLGSKIYQITKEALYNMPWVSNLFYRSEFRSWWQNFDQDETKWVSSTIPVMRDLVRNKGAEFVITHYPSTNFLSPANTRQEVWKNFIKRIFERYNIVIADSFPFLIANAKATSMVWSLTDKHPSCDAHEIMARFLYEQIKPDL
jgi:hypothetical protein